MKIPRRIFRNFIAVQQITHNKGIKVVVFFVRLAILKECVIVDGFPHALFAPAVVQLVICVPLATLFALVNFLVTTTANRATAPRLIRARIKPVSFLTYGLFAFFKQVSAIFTTIHHYFLPLSKSLFSRSCIFFSFFLNNA